MNSRPRPILVSEAITKTYRMGGREIPVLKGISLEVGAGDFVFVFGPSGVGKSTLLHVAGGLDRPNAGRVFVDGEDVYALSDRRRARIRNRHVGFVFQFYHLSLIHISEPTRPY